MRGRNDPFAERERSGLRHLRLQLLGGCFDFESHEPRLLNLVRWAYGGLPCHRLSSSTPSFRLRLRLADAGAPSLISGAGLLGASSAWADTVLLSPQARAGLVVVTEALLATPYRVRYELIEFAVCTLASRAQGLVALHGAAVGLRDRGLLLVGDSGAGKSTLTLQAAMEGFDLLSEDSVFVAPRTLLATGIANFLHLRADSLHHLTAREAASVARSPLITRRSGVEKFEVDLRARNFRAAREPLRLAAAVVVSPRRARSGRLLQRLSPAEGVARIARGQPYATGQRGWSTFGARLARLRVFELRRSASPRDSIDALHEALG